MGDMRLGLAFEESLVTALSQTGRRINDELGVGAEWNAAVASQVEKLRRCPWRVSIV